MALRPLRRQQKHFRQLSAANVNVNGAYVDADQLGLCYPLSPGGHFSHRLIAANPAAAWQGYRAADPTYLIVSGFIDTIDEINLYPDAIPAPP